MNSGWHHLRALQELTELQAKLDGLKTKLEQNSIAYLEDLQPISNGLWRVAYHLSQQMLHRTMESR